MSQVVTQAHSQLSIPQERAIELLLSGANVTESAKAAGVARETVHRWMKDDWDFIAAWNRAKRELAEVASARLFAVSAKAAENIARAVEAGDLRMSLLVLKGFGGLGGRAPSVGSEDPAVLAQSAAFIDHQARSIQRLLNSVA